MLLTASANGSVGMEAGWRILSAGGSALDAVEAATREVEDNPNDHSVGYSGYPNMLGKVELDASIMDGATRRAGTRGGGPGRPDAVRHGTAGRNRWRGPRLPAPDHDCPGGHGSAPPRDGGW